MVETDDPHIRIDEGGDDDELEIDEL